MCRPFRCGGVGDVGSILTLVIVPVMYSSFDSVGAHLGAWFRGRRAEEPVAVYAGNGHANGHAERPVVEAMR